MNAEKEYSLAVCYPVWNRPDLFETSLASLRRQLEGVKAAIWIFDDGSDATTREFIEGLACAEHHLFKAFLPQNMGIPFVVNLFSHCLTQDCDYAGSRAPRYAMLADADAYFKKPVRHLIEILESHNFAIVSGHDSIEHESVRQFEHLAGETTTRVKVKTIERGLCLVMKKETLAVCVPFPHETNMNVDWELMQWHPQSVAARQASVGAVDYVAHIGLYDSTHHSIGVPADHAGVAEINNILGARGVTHARATGAHGKVSRGRTSPRLRTPVYARA